VGFCEHGDELSGSIIGGEFLDQMSQYQLLETYVWVEAG
jgi:hypothetical protein